MKHCYALAAPDIPLERHVFGLNGDFKKNLRLIKECGYDGADLIVCRPSEFRTLDVVTEFERLDLVMPFVCTGEIVGAEGMELASPDPVIRRNTVERFYEFINLAAELGGGVNIGRSRGCIHKGYSKEQADQFALGSFQCIAEYAQKKQVVLALEPVTKQMTNYINNIEEAMEIVRKVDNPFFGYMLDTQHMYLDEENYIRTISKYAKNSAHIHLADSGRGPVGSGEIDFERMAESIFQSGYDGTFSHEPSAAGVEEDAMYQSMKFMAQIFDRCKSGTEFIKA